MMFFHKSREKKEHQERCSLIFISNVVYFSIAAIPGSFLPSMASSKAPPPVDT